MADWFLLSGVRPVVLLLVLMLAFVVLRYSWSNFRLDPRRGQFMTYLSLCITAVVVLIVTNHILLFLAAWIAISLLLHQLLMFYPQRPRAVLAAHKKFILARFSELFLATALVLIYLQTETLFIDQSMAIISQQERGWYLEFAALSLVMAALIKCAQLPLHGWLIQVVEAPTPVSALLHAGIINLGGLLLLVTTPVWSDSQLAVWWLCLVAAISSCVAALIMTTRISIKVRLAWSTSAQMGLMLVEIGLGYYELALLHLVAHSIYKAHAFLSVSEVAYIKQPQARSIFRVALVFIGFQAMTIGLALLVSGQPKWVPSALLAMALASLWLNLSHWRVRLWMSGVLLVAYFALSLTVKSFFLVAPQIAALELVVAAILNIFAVSYWIIHHTPQYRLSQRWFISLNAGLYLDEWLTRLVLWLWPSHPIRYYQKRNKQVTA